MPDTTTTLVGNLTDDPEVRYTDSGTVRGRWIGRAAWCGASERGMPA